MAKVGGHNKVPREKIIEDLKKATKKVEGILTIEDYKENGNYSMWHFTGSNKFDSFNSAKREAGLKTCKPGYDSSGEKAHKPEFTKNELKKQTLNYLKTTNDVLTIENLADFMDVKKSALDRRLTESHPAEKYFDGIYNLLESVGYDSTSIYEEWANVITDEPMYGWVKYREFRERLSEESQIMFLKNNTSGVISAKEFFDYINENVEGVFLRKSSLGGNGSRIYIRNENVDRFAKYKDRLPDIDGADEVFDRCISYGKGPKSALAAIKYLCGNKTQREVMEEVDTQGVSLRGTRDFILDEGLDENLV